MTQQTAVEPARARHIVGTIYATLTGLKIGTRGREQTPTDLFATLSKSHTRIVRKALRSKGFAKHAAAPRRSWWEDFNDRR